MTRLRARPGRRRGHEHARQERVHEREIDDEEGANHSSLGPLPRAPRRLGRRARRRARLGVPAQQTLGVAPRDVVERRGVAFAASLVSFATSEIGSRLRIARLRASITSALMTRIARDVVVDSRYW